MKSALQTFGAVSAATLILFGAPPGMDAAAGTITYAEALRRATQFNHGLNAARLAAESAKDAAEQAGAFPNPSIEGRFENLGRDEIEMMLSQTIELGGKRRAREDAARSAARSTVFARDAAEIDLEAETMRRFAAMVASDRRLVLVDASVRLAAGAAEQIGARVRAGATRESDLIQAEIATEELRAERELLARDREKALLALSALWGETEPGPLTAAETFSEHILPPGIDTLRRSMEDHPASLGLRERRELAASELAGARAARIPDLEIGAGIVRYGETGDEQLVLAASLPLPLFNRNRAAVRERERLAAAVESEGREALTRREVLLQVARTDIEGASDALQALDAEIIPRARTAFERLRSYYGSGAVSFLEMNEARRDLVRLQLRRIETLRERALAAADLLELAGYRLPVFTEK